MQLEEDPIEHHSQSEQKEMNSLKLSCNRLFKNQLLALRLVIFLGVFCSPIFLKICFAESSDDAVLSSKLESVESRISELEKRVKLIQENRDQIFEQIKIVKIRATR